MSERSEIENLKKLHSKEIEVLEKQVVKLKEAMNRIVGEKNDLMQKLSGMDKLEAELKKAKDENKEMMKKYGKKPLLPGEKWEGRIR